MSARKGDEEVLELEVERLPYPDEAPVRPPAPRDPARTARRVHRALGPVLAGLLADVLDAATMTPLLGLVLGLPVGYYLACQLGLKNGAAGRMALVVALYCAVPGTFFLPLGTLAGAYVRLRQVLSGGD